MGLRLAGDSLLAVVRSAPDHALGRGWRWLLAAGFRAEIAVDPQRLLELPAGGLVLYRARGSHAAFLNEIRPRIRGRRVVLWVAEGEDEILYRDAPDFMDWASHTAFCPWTRALPVERNFSAALRGAGLVHWDSASPPPGIADRPELRVWSEIVAQAHLPGRPPCVHVPNDLFFLRRARWALTEIRRKRKPQAVIWSEAARLPGWWHVSDRLAGLDTAARQVGPLIAALSDLEPEVVALAEGLLETGTAEAEIVESLCAEEDPGVGLARLAATRWGLDTGELGGRFGPLQREIPGLCDARGPTALAHRAWYGTPGAAGAVRKLAREAGRSVRGGVLPEQAVIQELATRGPVPRAREQVRWLSLAFPEFRGADVLEWMERWSPSDGLRHIGAVIRYNRGGDAQAYEGALQKAQQSLRHLAEGKSGTVDQSIEEMPAGVLEKFAMPAVAEHAPLDVTEWRSRRESLIRETGTDHHFFVIGLDISIVMRILNMGSEPPEDAVSFARELLHRLEVRERICWAEDLNPMKPVFDAIPMLQIMLGFPADAEATLLARCPEPLSSQDPQLLSWFAYARAARGEHAEAAGLLLQARRLEGDPERRARLDAEISILLARAGVLPSDAAGLVLGFALGKTSAPFGKALGQGWLEESTSLGLAALQEQNSLRQALIEMLKLLQPQ